MILGGPTPNQDPNTTTRRNEIILGISEPHVYAYLGRPIEAFGSRAIAVKQTAINGKISPFDTGGLVQYIVPLNQRSKKQRIDFLFNYSWSSNELSTRIREYPGAELLNYVNGRAPAVDGPHDVWRCGPKEPIWNPPNNWQAWTWEGRSPDAIGVNSELVAWTCRPDEYAKLVDCIPDLLTGGHREGDVLAVLKKYKEGGVSAFVADLHSIQGIQGATQ